jgi:hypothetical protein
MARPPRVPSDGRQRAQDASPPAPDQAPDASALPRVDGLDLVDTLALASPGATGSRLYAGFRVWRLIDGELRSPYRHEHWDQPVLHATCRAGSSAPSEARAPEVRHRAPHPGCRCGIYVSDAANVDFSHVDFRGVTGVVTVWGALVRERDGVRAEYAKVSALGLYSHWTSRQKEAVRDVAWRLEADVVDLQELPGASGRYGARLPAGSQGVAR